MTAVSRLANDRRPGSVEEAQRMVAYNLRILQTSASAQRRHRAERMLENLKPILAQLERDEAERIRRIEAAAPPESTFEGQLQRRVRDVHHDEGIEFETVWAGGEGLTTMGERRAR